jgi:hypothetical protein
MSSTLQSAFLSANRGPLTRIFTPPTSCLSETTLVSYETTISSLTTSYTTTKIFINHYSWGDGACYPSTIATIDGSTRWNNGYYYCRRTINQSLDCRRLERADEVYSSRNMSEWLGFSLPGTDKRLRVFDDLGKRDERGDVLPFVGSLPPETR